jgi:ABC-type multidrug transport system ATPase subunit
MSDAPLVVAEGLTKRFRGGKLALDEVSFRVLPGQVTGLVGPDGAGKTTLMRLMAGLLHADRGRLEVCGLDPARQARALHRVIGYMPQRFGLYEDLAVLENLVLYADLRGLVGRQRQKTFDRLLGFTDLAAFTRRLAGKLSGGMKQKLGIACALVRAPALLLLDEPSVGVDPISRRELWSMVYELVNQGIGVVWSTSYLDEADRCGSVLMVHEGRVLDEGPPQELARRVEGRTFLVRELADSPRVLLARALRLPDVVDGVVQGQGVRLVSRSGDAPLLDELDAGPEAELVPVEPRFEDAFITLLGGAPKADFAATPAHDQVVGADGDARPAVEAGGLTKRFGDFTAAHDISFAIRRGEIFGLLGPNGAGKSTIFKMMCGLLRPTAGRAAVAGLDLYSAPAAARARLGYMAQKFSLYGDLSVGQNLDFFAGAYGLGGPARQAVIRQAIDDYGLAPYLDASAGGLPLGFKQRLALACAVMHRPAVLFLDEPTSGVDPLARREFWMRINAMVESGVTVMVTTHFLDEAEYCDRVALIYRGSMIAHGTPDELKMLARSGPIAEPTLEDAFIQLIERYDDRRAASRAG